MSTAAELGGAAEPDAAAPPRPAATCRPSLTTSVYRTRLGLFAITWTRHRLGRTLRLQASLDLGGDDAPPSLCASYDLSPHCLRLQIKPLLFWRRRGSRKLGGGRDVRVFWDLSRAEFESRPEPQSRFFVAVTIDGEMALLVGDLRAQAQARARAAVGTRRPQALILRRENVFGNRAYATKATIGGRIREILIDCSRSGGEDLRLSLSVDRRLVLQIKRLKWKFRGNERIEVDGVWIQVSWDVYNWVFGDAGERHAVFLLGFEKQEPEVEGEEEEEAAAGRNPKLNEKGSGGGNRSWSMRFMGLGIEGAEWRKKGLLRSGRSRSSSSLSSASSSGGGSSVMEWSSVEENELLNDPAAGFSLLVHAWKSGGL